MLIVQGARGGAPSQTWDPRVVAWEECTRLEILTALVQLGSIEGFGSAIHPEKTIGWVV